MKRILIVLFTVAFISALSFAQTLSGAYTVGSGQTYTTLGAAVTALNTNGSSGAVEFTIMGSFSESADVTVGIGAGLTSTNTLTIRPGVGVNATITFASTAQFRTGGYDYITINGKSSSADGSLTLKHSGTSAGNSVVWIEGNSDNITIQNCVLGDATNTPDYAIKTSGSPGNKINNLTIQNNTIHGIGNTNGIIYFLYVEGTNSISGNIISGDQTGGTKAIGVYLENCAGTTAIQKNRIHTLNCSGNGINAVSAVQEGSPSGGTLTIDNNYFGGNVTSSGDGDVFLLALRGSSTRSIYHNTFVVNTITGAPFYACGLYISAGSATFKNNIVINNFDQSGSDCIVNGLTTFANLTSNNNDLYSPGTNNKIGSNGTASYEMTFWRGLSGTPDINSSEVAVTFVNSATDFDLAGGSNGDLNLMGADLTSTVSDDIDGTARKPAPNGPYMGAFEAPTNLPIQLAAITVTANRLDAVLRWSTATEVNNHGFEVERRSMGAGEQGTSTSSVQGAWDKVGFVSGAGTSTSPKDYSYVDAGLSAGRYAYRIKQVDNDGSFTYYLAAEVEVGVTEKVLALEANYPNPFNPSTNIAFSVPENGKVALKVFNIIGQEVAVLFDGIAEAGKLYQQSFDASQLPTGLYFSRLEFGGKSLMRKMLFVK